MTHRSESQDDMNRSTADYVFWKINPGNGIWYGDEVKGNLLLMKYKAL